MAYNFHYTPTGTGVISGKEVLEQTEDAINDLGNTAISGVQEALDKAEQALTNSQNAVDDAQTALNTANNADENATTALNTVNNLSGTVTSLGNRVTTAEGNITNLQGRMTTAEGNISGLNTRMGTAEGNIVNLQTAVSTAQATANSAQQTANTARQQSYVLRHSSSSVTDNSTIAYSTLDNTDNIKSGDKVIDVDGKIFTVVSVDTANSTVTVGSALIDLALDGNVVHTSGNETVGGVKTFTNDNMIKTSSPKVLLINTSQTGNTAPSSNTASFLRFDGGTVNNFGGVQCDFLTTGENRLTNYVNDITKAKVNTIQQRANSTTAMTVFNADLLTPATDGVTVLGSSSKRWKDCQTYLINGLTPSSLSMPDIDNKIDISSYITNLAGVPNEYTPQVNGWICVRSANTTKISILDSATSVGTTNISPTATYLGNIVPCIANRKVYINIICTSLDFAYFIPCLGNI